MEDEDPLHEVKKDMRPLNSPFPFRERFPACEGVALAKTQEGACPPKLLAKVDAEFRRGEVFLLQGLRIVVLVDRFLPSFS